MVRTLMVVARRATDHLSVDGVIVGRKSTDDGLTWGAEFTVVDDVSLDLRDPSLALLADGRIACTYFHWDGSDQTDPSVVFTSDYGATWSAPVALTNTYTGDVGCSGPIIDMGGGVLVAAIHGRNSFTTGLRSCRLLRSTDNGATWAEYSTIATSGVADFVEPSLSLRPDGDRLYCLLRRDDDQTTWRTWSDDGGLTWETRLQAFAGHGRPANLYIAQDTVMAAFRGTSSLAQRRQSNDGGESAWNSVVNIHSATTDTYQYAQWAIVRPGVLGIAYALEEAADADNANLYFRWATYDPDAIPPILTWSPTIVTITSDGDYVAFPGLVSFNEPVDTSGTETPWEPPPPARALIEVYVPDPDADRWGEALWGTGVWSSAQWTNVTPQSVSADISWGATRADAGILATPEAGLWTVITYDPDRILDAGNPESPYAPAITYGLPIRINHRGRTIRTGFIESVTYSLATKFGEIRATDNIAALAAADVPPDVELSDTLYARARDVIAAVGLPITVGPAPGSGDPAVAPWEPGDFKAWRIIYETALEALHIPYLGNTGSLQFRSWLNPLDRDSVVGSPELIDLVSFVSPDSLYSVVQAVDEAAVEVERRVTPLPRYGERVYRRTLATLNAGDWADVVLEDRALTALRYRPGAIYPLDAGSVEFLASLQIGELLTLEVPEADPDVEVKSRILGVRLRVVDLGGQAGPDWRWFYVASTAALEPLIADLVALAPPYLVDDDTGEYLYPDGVIGLE